MSLPLRPLLLLLPPLPLRVVWGPQATCNTDYDCYATLKLGTNGAQPGGTVKCISGMCTCTIWTPRERFAAAAHGQSIYVVGGVTEVTREVSVLPVCVSCACVCACV